MRQHSFVCVKSTHATPKPPDLGLSRSSAVAASQGSRNPLPSALASVPASPPGPAHPAPSSSGCLRLLEPVLPAQDSGVFNHVVSVLSSQPLSPLQSMPCSPHPFFFCRDLEQVWNNSHFSRQPVRLPVVNNLHTAFLLLPPFPRAANSVPFLSKQGHCKDYDCLFCKCMLLMLSLTVPASSMFLIAFTLD